MSIQLQGQVNLDFTQADAQLENFRRKLSSKDFSQPLGRISGDAAEFRKSLEAATARVTAFGLTAGAIYKVSEAIRAGARATIEVDKQLVELNTFLGQSKNQLEDFSRSLFKVARNAAVPFEAASEAAKEFARQGLSTNEVLKRTEDALTLARISGINYGDAVNGITTAINSFNKEALSSTDIINKLIAVDTRFAVSSAQLNEALTRVGSSAEESGISIDKLIATVTAAQQITGRGGAVIGNALKTIFTRLQRPEVITQLQQLGVSVKDQNGFLLDGISILKNYADATKNLSQIEKSRTAELIGGIYQINQVNALIKDLSSSNSVYANALRISTTATDEAKKKNEELNKSMSALLQNTKNQAQEAAAVLGKSMLEPMVRIGSEFTKMALKFVNPESDLLGSAEKGGESLGSSFAKGAASALGKTLATGGIPLAVGVGGTLLAKMAKFGVSSVRNISKDYQSIFSEKTLIAQERINDLLRQNPSLITSVQNKTMTLAQVEQKLLDLIKLQNRELAVQASIRARVVPTVVSKGGPGKIRAGGYIPNFAMSAEQEEVATAKAYGAKNPVPRVIQATIRGKTGPVVVNNQEKVIPNFAGTRETAIIPNYRNIEDVPRMSSGYVPNFAFSSMKSLASEDRKFVDPETYSYLRYKLSNDKKAIDLKFSKSEMKGQGWQMFERLGKTARRMGLPVRSSNLSSQTNDVLDITDASLARAGKYGIEEVLKVGYPQLIHRQKGSSKNTTLSLNIDDGLGHNNNELSGKNIFSVVSDFASKKYKGDAKLFRNSIIDGSFDISNVETNFAGGRIPNFAKRKDIIQRIGKKEIFARFQKHYEQGKDYAGFYNIHGEEFGGKKLSPQEAKIYANITSAISPSVPDYVAAQFAAPIFNRFMQTRSTNVEDYFDVAPTKIVSRHKNVASLGLFGLAGTLSNKGKIRTRDDVRRSGLSKALRGIDLGSDDTAKTRHYARAILQDKTAFPIDTNVIQAILGGKTPSKTEAAKLISLANEFAKSHQIETGAAGLQAAIFKSNSVHKEKYNPETVRSALSGIEGRAGGYVPNFAKVDAEKLIIGGKGRNLILTSAYDSLKADLDPSSQISGGISYGLKFPDRSYASTARSAGVDAMQVLHDYAKKQGGRAFYAPHVTSSAMSKYGTAAGGMNKRNIFFLQQLVSKNKKDFPRSFVQSVLSINPANASLTGTGSLYDEAVKHLTKKGLSAVAIGKKFREGAAGLHDPIVEKYASQNKYSVAGVVSRVSDVGGSVAAPNSYHPLYSRSTYADNAISLSKGVDLPSEFERLTGVKISANKSDPKNTKYQPLASFLPFGMRFEPGDEISQMFGGLAGGYIPNFASTFNAEKIKQMGGYVGQANKASAPGLYNILNRIGIPIELDNITKKGLTDALSSKENKLKLYNFLKQEPIEITNYPDSYSEVKDGNHRFTLAQFAGIKNIPAKYKDNFSDGYIPNFSGLSDAVSREKTMSGLPASQIMAHFDGGGNPVAVTNKRDEPNGLKDVVPNFAAPRVNFSALSKSVKNLFGKLKGSSPAGAPANAGAGTPSSGMNPISGSFELFAAQAIQSAFDELAEREVISANTAKFAGYAIPAGVGGKNIYRALTDKSMSTGQKVLTGLTGAAQAGGGAFLASKTSGDLDQRIQNKKLSEEIDNAKRNFQNLTENTSELATTLSKLDAAYKDPKADPREITKLVKSREDIIKKITIKNPELISKLAGQESLTGKIDLLEENQKEQQRILSLKESASAFRSKGKISGADAPGQLAAFFEEAINRGGSDLLKQDFNNATPANFAEILKKGGLDIKEFSSVFNSDDLKKSFISSLKLAQELQAISAKQDQDIREKNRPLAEAKQRVGDAREIRAKIKESLEQQLPELASFAGNFSKRAGISASSEASLAIKKSDAAVAFQNSLLGQLNDKEFLRGLPPEVERTLRSIEAPGESTARELQKLEKLPGLGAEQVRGIQRLIDFNSVQTRDLTKSTIIAEESKKIQLKFLALQEKAAFGGDIRTSINPQMRADAMNAGIRGPLTYQLGGLIGSRRSQVAGATDFITDTLQRYPGLLQTKDGKEPRDIQAVKGELTQLNALDMQKDLLKRAGMAQMMGLGQTASLLQGKAFDPKYLLESAGLKANALFESPDVPKEVRDAMKGYEQFNVNSVRAGREEDKFLRGEEERGTPIKEKIVEESAKQAKVLAEKFEAALKATFGANGVTTTSMNVTATGDVKFGQAKAAEGTGVPSSANGLTKYSNSIADAVKREKTALASRGIMGVPNFAMADINLERSPDLMSASNPAGFAITNSIDEKNGLRSLGMRSSGFVPNYALPSWMSASNLDKARSVFTNADDAQSLLSNIKEGNIGGAAMDLAGPALDAAKFAAKNVAKKAGLGAAGIGLDVGEYVVKPLSEKLGVTDYLADRMYNALYAKPEKSNIVRASDAYNSRLGNDLIDPSPEYMKKAKVPNFAKSSNIDPLLERIYGPRADIAKTAPSVPAPIQGVSQKTMPFFPERLVNETYPFGNRPSMGNVNPTVKPGRRTPAQDPSTGKFISKSQAALMQKIEQGRKAKAAQKAQLAQGSPAGFSGYFKKPGLQEMLALTPEEQARIRRGAFESSQRAGAAQMTEYQRTFLAQKASELQPSKQSGGLKLLPKGQSPTPLFTGKSTSPLGLLPRGQGTFKGQAFVPETSIPSGPLKLQSKSGVTTPSLRLSNYRAASPGTGTYLDALLTGSEENFKLAAENERQAAANRYFQKTEPLRQAQREQNLRQAAQAAENAKKGQRINISEAVRRFDTRTSAKSGRIDLTQAAQRARESVASNFKQYSPEEVNKILSGKPVATPAAVASPEASGILNKLKGAGKFGLKGLGIAGAVGFGGAKAFESYSSAKEGKYGQATLAGLSSAASFAGLIKGAGKVAGPAGVVLGGLTDLNVRDLTLASDWKDIFGRKERTYSVGPDGKTKEDVESIGIGDVIGTGLSALASAPATVGLLGYRAGNILENKLGLGTKLGDLAAGSMTARASYEAGIRPRGGMTVNEAVKSNQLVSKKSELVGQINKLNQIAGNPLISRDFQISASRRGQAFEEDQRIEELKKRLDEENKATRAGITSRATAAGAAETARLNKESAAEEEARNSKLRKTFLESFDKNAESAGYLTTQDKANYLLSQEGKNGLGSFRSTDFKDAEFARSFNNYKAASEAEAAREANRVIPKSAIEFRNRPMPSFPQDVLEEATKTGRSAERVIQDREEINIRRGATSQGMAMPEINAQMSRDYTSATGAPDFPKDVLEEATRRRVTAEQVMQERAGGRVPNFAAMSNSMMSSGDVYSRMRSSASRNIAPSYAQGAVPNFAAAGFTDAITEALKTGITSAFPNGGSSSNVSNSNVINIDGRTSIQNAPDEAMQGIIGILFDKIPELKKLGPAALNFKR